jgi:ribokinase
VDLRFVHAIPERTFWTLALLGPGGEKSLVEFPTPAVRANWEGFDWSAVQRMRFVHLIPDNREEELRLFKLARDCGVTTSLDLEASMLDYANILDLVSMTDVLFLSAPASEHFSPDLRSASQRLTEMGVKTILITLGAGGCFVKEPAGDTYQIPGHSVVPLDTTGAGDCFAGAFAYGRLCGWPDRDSAELANLMAALSTTAYGSRGAIYSASELCPIAEEKGYPWWRRLK